MFLSSFVKKYGMSYVLVLISMIAFCRLAWQREGFAQQVCSYITYPAIVFSHRVVDPIRCYLQEKRDMQALRAELTQIQEEVRAVRAQNIALLGQKTYEQDTHDMRNFKKKYDLADAVVSQVLVRHFSDRAHYFLVEGGANSNIRSDMVAICNNTIIGKVVEVYPWYSKIALITDKSCKIAALDAQTQACGVLEGANREQALLRYVDHLCPVAVGDVIISSGQGLIFPQGFGLGRVVRVASAGLHHDITVAPLIELAGVDYCLLVAKESIQRVMVSVL